MNHNADHGDVWVAAYKLIGLWIAYFTSLNLMEWLQLLTQAGVLVFTVLQIFVLARDKLWRKKTSR